jgi:hypothetical protein
VAGAGPYSLVVPWRISLTVPIALSVLATTCAARARWTSSVAFALSSSAFARMTPSSLFKRWNRSRSSEDSRLFGVNWIVRSYCLT